MSDVTNMTPSDPSARSRRGLATVAIALLILWIGLVIALLMLLGARTPVEYPSNAGITPLQAIYGPGIGAKPFFKGPMGAAFGPDGLVYVADTGNSRIVVFRTDGSYVTQFGGLGVAKPAPGGKRTWKPGLLNYPTDVAVDEAGDVYVADFGNDQIQVFDAKGTYLRSFPAANKQVGKGASGKDGTGAAITSVAVRNGQVLATDKYQVLVFDTEGTLLRQFGKPGRGPGDLDHPNGVDLGLGSSVIVSDSNHNRVVGMTQSGRALWSVGRQQSMGIDTAGSDVQAPRGLTQLNDGSTLVADALAGNLVNISRDGRLIGTYGSMGESPGFFMFPTDVAADSNGLLVIAEKGLDRVQVVQLER